MTFDQLQSHVSHIDYKPDYRFYVEDLGNGKVNFCISAKLSPKGFGMPLRATSKVEYELEFLDTVEDVILRFITQIEGFEVDTIAVLFQWQGRQVLQGDFGKLDLRPETESY